jgi:serine/threonine-protein kinase
MKRSGPLYTLLAGLALAVFMLVLNATTGEGTSSYAGAPAATATPSPSPSPTATTASPSPSTSPSPSKAARGKTSYAGRTDDDTAAVSVSVRGDKAVAYFCDGRSKESWLKGNVEDDGSMKLSGSHGARLVGDLAGDRVRGTVEINQHPYGFTAKKAVKPSGLYRATTEVRGAKIDGGWIVLPGGRQVGIVRRDDKPSAAPRIDPRSGAVTVDGERLTARPVVP